MFGTRDPFEYIECAACGTVQIADVPDLARYYPKDYFSFDADREIVLAANLRRRMGARLAGGYLTQGKGLAGKLMLKYKPWIADHFPPSMRAKCLGLDRDSRILDFGSGGGHLLQTLHYFGFRDLSGADAFIQDDVEYDTGVKVYKKRLSELEPSYDLIMLHHAFEHVSDPFGTLVQLHRLIAPEKYCLIRIPIVNFAWEKYEINWVQLDPPRHLFLYTEQALIDLAEKAGFVVDEVIYDSTAMQFWGSEQYVMDIPLNDSRSENIPDNQNSVFDRTQIELWQRQADELNTQRRGDQACFYLRRR